MEQMFHILQRLAKDYKDTVLVTVIESRGSAPRRAGARMIVTRGGRNAGTIGGGALEHSAVQRAMQVLEERKSGFGEYHLSLEKAAELGMVCGGSVRVHYQYLPWEDAKSSAVEEEAGKRLESGKEIWLVRDLLADQGGMLRVCERTELPEEIGNVCGRKLILQETEGHLYCFERVGRPGTVYIFGGGHVSQALVPVLSAVDFRCVVLEDREEFCSRELFPEAWDVRKIRYDRILEEMDIREEDFVCVMTRGHKDDLQVQTQVLKTKASYIGVIGSRRKAAAVAKRLEEEYQIPPEEIARVHTPIGLSIGAETPEEIAVSIAAELIRHRADAE